jgi:SNF2 family DNA or RNA helicase
VGAEVAKKKREKILSDVFTSRHCRVVISSYHIVANMVDLFAGCGTWDYVVLDEGHCIKTPGTKISKAVHTLRSHHRVMVTGTPMQNKLTEFFHLVDWATCGTVLGSKASFVRMFEEPIVAGRDPKATPQQVRNAKLASDALMKAVKPVLLQRKKCEFQDVLRLKRKTEVVVWVPLSTSQRKEYERYLRDRNVQLIVQRSLKQHKTPVEVVNALKTISR